jgi:hypothetical protein
LQSSKEVKKQRTYKQNVGGTEYTVIVEEASGAKLTQFEVINKLIQRHSDETIQSTNLLFGANGGNKC